IDIEKQVAADGTFAVTFNPCPRQNVTGAGTFPVSDGDQFTFSADALKKSGTGDAAIWISLGVGDAANYTVSGLGNAGLPGTGAAVNGVGIAQPQPSPFTLVLFAGVALIALGWCLLLLERAQHRAP